MAFEEIEKMTVLKTMAFKMAVKMTLELAVLTRKALKVTVVKMNLHMAVHLHDSYLHFHLVPENQ